MTSPLSAARRQEIVAAVLAGLERGTPLTVVVESLGMPAHRNSVYNWLRDSDELREAIGFARDLGFDWIAHECLQIIDNTDGDVIWDAEGVPHPNPSNVLRDKLRFEGRLKLLAKWDPRRYGDTKRVEVEATVETTHRHVVDSRTLTDEGRAALRRLLGEAQAQGLLPPPDQPDDHDVIDAIEAEYHEVIDEAGEGDDDEAEVGDD